MSPPECHVPLPVSSKIPVSWKDPPSELPAPVSRRVRLATGLEYHCLEWNADTDAQHTVFLIHGFLDLGRSWQPVVESGLGAGLHLVAPDMRGHGWSDRVGPGGYYHFMDYLADLASLVELVGREQVSLVGHSMGGSITSYFAGSFPARIKRLALLEGLGPPEDQTAVPERVTNWISAWKRQAHGALKSYADVAEAAKRLQRLDPLLDDQLATWLVAHSTRELPEGGLCFLHDPLHLTTGPYPYRLEIAESFWQRVACPTLFVDGAESFLRHAEAEAARRKAFFALGRSALLEGAGHMMMRHRPHELAALLQAFLTE